MAVELRPELVGKRFLCVAVGEETQLRLGESGCSRRGWRAGVIRAVSHRDCRDPDLAVRDLCPPILPAHSCTPTFPEPYLEGFTSGTLISLASWWSRPS